uniref:Uncharacterized protein n=1 Tax=Arundo donax TaxID=35708 RepID=A0A0A9G5Z6_ARUDO
MTLGLSGAAPQMHAFADQGQSSSAAQFDHILPSSSGSSMFRSQVSASTSPFFLGGGAPPPAQDFSEDGSEHSQGGALLHGKPSFHSMMQLPEQSSHSSSNTNANILNLRFFSGNTGGSAGGQDARLAFQDQFNGGAAGNGGGGGNSNAEQSSVIASIGNHFSGSFPSLYNSSGSAAGLPQNSATALLLKAAQMGSTTSSSQNGPTALLRAAGFGANGQGTSRAAGEGTAAHETQFHDLIMNSLAGGGGSFSGAAGFGAVDNGKLSTRDFLGVGRGAMATPGLHIGSLDPAQMK